MRRKFKVIGYIIHVLIDDEADRDEYLMPRTRLPPTTLAHAAIPSKADVRKRFDIEI